jgi:biopolymer transport protein ExbD
MIRSPRLRLLPMAFEVDDEKGITGINVTPLVDVTLVLLIVFLVTAKTVLIRSLPLELPTARTSVATTPNLLSISVDEDGRLRFDGATVSNDDELVKRATARRVRDREEGHETKAVIHASAKAQHGAVVHAVDLLRMAEIERVAFATRPK